MSKEAGRTDRMSSAIASRLADCLGMSTAWICGLDVNEDFKVELTGEECEFAWEENYPVMWQEVWQTAPHNVIISKVITTPNIPNSMCP